MKERWCWACDKWACGSLGGGVLLMALAGLSKLTGWGFLDAVGPKSFAAAAELFLLLSIALSVCHMTNPQKH